jgi:6-pyruvoyl-tetrahydropterin synthase
MKTIIQGDVVIDITFEGESLERKDMMILKNEIENAFNNVLERCLYKRGIDNLEKFPVSINDFHEI